jgi:hypothetical protein
MTLKSLNAMTYLYRYIREKEKGTALAECEASTMSPLAKE